jgi:hypothetical protein
MLMLGLTCGKPVENLWKTPVPSELQFYLNPAVARDLP